MQHSHGGNKSGNKAQATEDLEIVRRERKIVDWLQTLASYCNFVVSRTFVDERKARSRGVLGG